MDIQIERFDVGRDETAVLALLRSSLGWPSDSFFDELFRWKHLRGPWGPSPAWIARSGDEVVGFRAMMRWQFSAPTGTLRAVRAVDTATDPAHQGKGIFKRLTLHALAELEADGVDFVFNTPNDQSRPGYLKMGWQTVGQLVPRVVLPGPLAPLKMLKARAAADHRPSPSPVGVPASELGTPVQPPGDGLVRTDRSEEFLSWRYGWAPLGYRAITSDDGTAIFRNRARGGAIETVVSDLLVDGRSTATSAVRHLSRRAGGDYVLGLPARPYGLPGSLPLRGQGPVLTWRSVCNPRPLNLDELALTMGDVELF